jgi:hypothetical protein
MIERQIIIGSIVSTEYLHQLVGLWNVRFFESPSAKRLARWIWQYYSEYNKAPGRQIEQIFFEKLKTDKISKEVAEEIEHDILPGLSAEYEQDGINIDYLLDLTRKYFNERNLTIHKDAITGMLEKGELQEAEQLACSYEPLRQATTQDLDLSSTLALERVHKAFTLDFVPLIKYSGALGGFWNDQLIRGGFVALLAPEKRGKTWMLLDLAIRACEQKRKVAFFQAGDMSESQQLKRICIYLAWKSNMERYTGEMYQPEADCGYNQNNTCKKEERTCSTGIFDKNKTIADIKKNVFLTDLIEAYKNEKNEDYSPCTKCKEYEHKHIGVPWIKKVVVKNPLGSEEAQQVIDKFFIKYKLQFKLSTYANDTLSVKMINSTLDIWEKQDGFIPDVIVIDYADLLTTEIPEKDFRQAQNKIWKGLRNLSQTRGNPLVITATQANAASYERDSLRMKNFSEDKRKYGHVTAMYGLNQDTQGREKKIGLMRINAIVQREGEFFADEEVTILQNIKRGRPFLGSYL